MPTLTFAQSHLSITDFPTITLPDFTIITGPNGAGKSHLLQAIQLGHIRTDVAPNQNPNNQNQIRMFDWSNMIPQDSGYFSSDTIRGERQNLWNHFVNLRQNQAWLEPARQILRRIGFEGAYLTEPGRVLVESKEELSRLLNGRYDASALQVEVQAALAQFDANVLNNLDENTKAQISAVQRFSGQPLSMLKEKDILSPQIPHWGQTDLFQQNFAKLFVAYRDLLLSNTIAEFRASKGHNALYLSEAEFVERHGPAPWDVVTKSIGDAGLDFQINSPSLDDYTQFQPTLTKLSSGIAVPFSSLSSGEKVLMSFAFCVYYSNDSRQLAVRPKMLLLDEIDAPLHPSMSKNVIETITKTLVSSFGIKVIATTHSPSTIALAPEESVYTMKPGRPGLEKSSKAAALNILTVGVPTIAISYDGRRQVFVESPTDARIYDSLYKSLKNKISSERSLEFIATGTRQAGTGGGDTNTGCENVKRIVADLAAAGNQSVFGLLDWDGKHEPTERIAVLAHTRRNGLENVLFDPLLIGLTIARNFPAEMHQIGLQNGIGYLDVATADAGSLQPMVTMIGETIFKGKPDATMVAKYFGGLELVIDSRFGQMDDHRLEALALEVFPFLRSISKNHPGKFLEHIVSVTLSDTRFIPLEIKDVIVELLEKAAH